MDYIKEYIRIEEDGIYLVFAVTREEQLKLLHFSAKPYEEKEESELFLKEGFQLVQVSFSGYNRPYEKHGNKHIVTALPPAFPSPGTRVYAEVCGHGGYSK